MKVLNKRTDEIPDDAVYVGRPSKWGNDMSLRELRGLYPNDNSEDLRWRAITWLKTCVIDWWLRWI